MNADKLNMIAGAVIGAFLVLLLLNFVSGQIYGTRGHHGEEPLGFALAVESGDTAGGGEEAGPDYGALLASADAAAGEKVFGKCKSCHKVEDGANGLGPHLWGVVGRDIGSVAGFSYSDALAGMEGEWTLTSLSEFLHDPKGYAPGTKMSFAGLKKAEDRVNLIVWLNEADGSPVDLASQVPAGEKGADAGADEGTQTAAAPAESTETTSDAASSESSEAPAAESTEAATTESTESTEGAAASESTDGAAATESTENTDSAAAEGGSDGDGQQVAAADAQSGDAAAGSYPAGDAAAGEKVFRKCKACHKVEDGAKGVGLHLWGVVGRDIASVDGYSYSDALAQKDGAWTASELDAYLTNPKEYAPGTKMSFAGLKKDEDRVNVITYLNEADGSPAPLE